MHYVDPAAGNDTNPGTLEHPFATLERARAAAEPGSTVVLRGGTHRLTETFALAAADSGVTYEAYGHGTPAPEVPVISGGRPVAAWQNGEGGVRTAPVPVPRMRQLYVSGRRAERASAPIETAPTRTESGYVFDDPKAAAWQGDLEFVYHGVYPWSEARFPVRRTEPSGPSTRVDMAQPAFERATRLYRSIGDWDGSGTKEHFGVDNPTSVENSPAFLTEGTFATADGVLHYLPRAGEDPEDAVVPVLELLVHARDVHDVVFRGITFADATWLRPGSPEGFLHYHGNGHYDGGSLLTVDVFEGASVTVPGDVASIPGNVVFENASRVTVDGCRFTRMGGAALEFRGDGADNVVRRSEIDDVSGGGVVIGSGAVRHRVEDSRIHHVGREYSGSPAVLVSSGTTDSVVEHTRVDHVPHAGIVVYDGRGAQVRGNLVHDTMLVLAGGGGIYLSGPQGDSHANGAVIEGNVVRDTVTPYNFALYTDYGAAWVTVRDNVIHRADNPIALEVAPPLDNVVFSGNFWDAEPGTAPESVTLTDNTTLAPERFDTDPGVAAVVAKAGPR